MLNQSHSLSAQSEACPIGEKKKKLFFLWNILGGSEEKVHVAYCAVFVVCNSYPMSLFQRLLYVMVKTKIPQRDMYWFYTGKK